MVYNWLTLFISLHLYVNAVHSQIQLLIIIRWVSIITYHCVEVIFLHWNILIVLNNFVLNFYKTEHIIKNIFITTSLTLFLLWITRNKDGYLGLKKIKIKKGKKANGTQKVMWGKGDESAAMISWIWAKERSCHDEGGPNMMKKRTVPLLLVIGPTQKASFVPLSLIGAHKDFSILSMGFSVFALSEPLLGRQNPLYPCTSKPLLA